MNIQPKALTRGLCVFAFLAVAGCHSSSNGGGNSEPPPDTMAPTISAVNVPAGDVNRSVMLSVVANDNVGVTEVRFFVDGVLLGSDTSSPFAVEWDSSAETEGDHVLSAEARDAADNVVQSGELTVTVRNMEAFSVTLSGDQEVVPIETAATAEANLMVNLATGAVEGDLTVAGLVPTAAHIHGGFAGTNGGVLVPLEQDAGDPQHFTVPAGALLDTAEVDELLAGGLYVNVHTAANPGGALRGQILPDGFVLRFTELTGEQQVPRLQTFARGRAAVTLDQTSGAIVVHAQVEELDDASQAHVHEAYAGANGAVLVALQKDPSDSAHWFAEDAELNAAGLDAFAAGRLYVNVHSPANPGGEIRGQIVPDGIAVAWTELSGEQEVPAVDTSADALAAVTLDEAGSTVTIHVNTRRLDDASASHLHSAFGGVNGPVEIGLTQDGSNPSHWFLENQALSATQLEALLDGATYVNVHSPSHPGGEIRGQLIPEGVLFALGRLEGNQEVPPVTSAAGGTFAVTINTVSSTLVAHVNTVGADDAVAAHLHDAYAGRGGPVSIGLSQDAGNAAHWSVVDAPLDAAKLAGIRGGRFYVNVHTPANPGGEIRGQVAPPPIEVLLTALSGEQEVPSVASAATAVAASTVNRETGLVTLHLNATGADDATASHIHHAYAGQGGPVLVGLEQDASDLGHWSLVEEQLDAAGLADYLAGRFYVNLHTPANPGGEIRGQIAPRDIQILWSAMDGDQVSPPVVTAASGLVATTADLASHGFVAYVNAVGVDDATSAGIRIGGVGENGTEALALEQNPSILGQWSGASERLDSGAFSSYRAGHLYALVATPGQPNGEIRGQIVPPDAADFDDQAPTVTLASPGAVVNGTVTLEADANDDQGVAEVRFYFDGVLIGSDNVAPYSVDWDTTLAADGNVTLKAEAEDAAGNVGVSANVVVSIENGTPVTLSQIQAQVFTPRCSGCHSGPTSGALPSGMNLSSAASSHAALVNVQSLEVASLARVEPGDPDNSYLIQKLEGTAASGSRMPQGGPFLDQATIDMIRDWIADGAPSN